MKEKAIIDRLAYISLRFFFMISDGQGFLHTFKDVEDVVDHIMVL